ncbi:MAG: 3-methyl-2-oxobutanoate hydroxymethyltransferase [Phycisphaerae bacterium]
MSAQPAESKPAISTPTPMPSGKITISILQTMRQHNQPIAMLTCYDFPTARILARCGVPILLVGDSVATTVLGEDSTIHATMDFMVLLTRAVRRGAPEVCLMADMPFASYATADSAVANGRRFMTEGGADCVKLECDLRHEGMVRAMATAGIPVCAHLGLLPQRAAQEGGYRYQGRTEEQADELVRESSAMANAGAAMLLLEAVPDRVSRRIVEATGCLVLGCGAGPSCHGHVVVLHDMLGYTEKPPRFVERYGDIPTAIATAAKAYVQAVEKREYPQLRHGYGVRDLAT